MIHRAPHPELLQWDDYACEAACTAQLLYLHGLLEMPMDFKGFDALIGRDRDRFDLEAGCFRLLFQSGFEIQAIDPFEPQRLIDDIQYVRDSFVLSGATPEEAAAYPPELHAMLARRITNLLSLERTYSNQFGYQLKFPTLEDIHCLLGNGYVVQCTERTSEAGVGHVVLLTRPLPGGKAEVYNPAWGVTTYPIDEKFMSVLSPGIRGYRLS